MAKADHVPNLVRVAFPDASDKTSTKLSRPAGNVRKEEAGHRRHFIGGSDARIIMGDDEAALVRLWREKRGEVEPADLSGNLPVQLGLVTEDLNRCWDEANSGQVVVDVQRRIATRSCIGWGRRSMAEFEGSGAIFEAKFMLPWSFSENPRSQNTRRNFNTTCGLSPPEARFCRS